MCRGPNFNALQHCSRQNAFLTACVALQNRLTAVLCHCKDTFGYFFKTQVCSVPSPMHYSTSQGKSHSSLPRVTLQNRLTAVLCHCKDTFGYFFKTQVCSVPSPMHYSTGQGKMHSSLPVLRCKTGRQHCSVIAKTPLDISSTHRCAVSHHQCTTALLRAKCIPHCPELLCKTG